MRVAVVTELTARHDCAGGATRLEELAKSLVDRGHEITVFCSQWWEGGTDIPEFTEEGVRYRAVTYGSDSSPGRFGRRLPRLLYRFNPDVIHAAHDPPMAVLGATLAGTLTRTPVVVEWSRHAPRSGWAERLRRQAARFPERVITPSHLVKTGVLELGRPAESTEVIPSPVNMAQIRSIEAEHLGDIVFSRDLDGDANLENLLLALAELRTVGWSAVVIGDGPERARYEKQAADLRIDDRVTFLGELPLNRRLGIFRGARIAVHTARCAPFPREFLRALACGCVGIAEYHETSSAHEFIEQRSRGIGVTSEEDLADAIERAAELPHKSIEADFASFDETEIIERYLRCYREVRSEFGLF